MSRQWGTPKGDWAYECPRCSFEIWASQAVKEPITGLRVCSSCCDKVNPQMYVRGVTDDQKVPFSNHPPVVFQTVPTTADDL